MSTHANTDTPTDWADSMALWAEENAAELRHFTGTTHRAQPLPAERQWVAPQGRPAWLARRCSPEPEIMVIDRLPEDFDQSDSADAEVLVWLLKGLAVVLMAMLSAWCIASYLDLAHVA